MCGGAIALWRAVIYALLFAVHRQEGEIQHSDRMPDKLENIHVCIPGPSLKWGNSYTRIFLGITDPAHNRKLARVQKYTDMYLWTDLNTFWETVQIAQRYSRSATDQRGFMSCRYSQACIHMREYPKLETTRLSAHASITSSCPACSPSEQWKIGFKG